jgi:hypothetical protein
MTTRSGGPKDPGHPGGPKLIGETSRVEQEVRTESAREVKREKDRFDRQKGNVEDRQLRLQVHEQKRRAGRGVLIAQVLGRAERQLRRLNEEADAILKILAESDFGVESLGVHGKKLDRIREQLDDGSSRHHAQERALWEAQVGLTELDESRLSLAEERLATTGDLLALLDLIADIGNGTTGPRRLVVRGADRRAALEYAASTNPTTILLDAPFVALGVIVPDEPGGKLGRTLSGQRALEVAGLR